MRRSSRLLRVNQTSLQLYLSTLTCLPVYKDVSFVDVPVCVPCPLTAKSLDMSPRAYLKP